MRTLSISAVAAAAPVAPAPGGASANLAYKDHAGNFVKGQTCAPTTELNTTTTTTTSASTANALITMPVGVFLQGGLVQ